MTTFEKACDALAIAILEILFLLVRILRKPTTDNAVKPAS